MRTCVFQATLPTPVQMRTCVYQLMTCEASNGPWMSLNGSSYSQHLGRGALGPAPVTILPKPGAGACVGSGGWVDGALVGVGWCKVCNDMSHFEGVVTECFRCCACRSCARDQQLSSWDVLLPSLQAVRSCTHRCCSALVGILRCHSSLLIYPLLPIAATLLVPCRH